MNLRILSYLLFAVLFWIMVFYSPIVHFLHTSIYLRYIVYIAVFAMWASTMILTKRGVLKLNRFDFVILLFVAYTLLLIYFKMRYGIISRMEFVGEIAAYVAPFLLLYPVMKSLIFANPKILPWVYNMFVIIGVVFSVDILLGTFLIKVVNIKAIAIYPWALDGITVGSREQIVDSTLGGYNLYQIMRAVPTLYGYPKPHFEAYALGVCFCSTLAIKGDRNLVVWLFLSAIMIIYVKAVIVGVFFVIIYYFWVKKRKTVFIFCLCTTGIILTITDFYYRFIGTITYYTNPHNADSFRFLFWPFEALHAFFCSSLSEIAFGLEPFKQIGWNSVYATELRILSGQLFKFGAVWFFIYMAIFYIGFRMLTKTNRYLANIGDTEAEKIVLGLIMILILSVLSSLHYLSAVTGSNIHYLIFVFAAASSISYDVRKRVVSHTKAIQDTVGMAGTKS